MNSLVKIGMVLSLLHLQIEASERKGWIETFSDAAQSTLDAVTSSPAKIKDYAIKSGRYVGLLSTPQQLAVIHWLQCEPKDEVLRTFISDPEIIALFPDESFRRDLLNSRNEKLQTKLHILVNEQGYRARNELITYLVDLGVDINAQDSSGLTVADYLNDDEFKAGDPKYDLLKRLGAVTTEEILPGEGPRLLSMRLGSSPAQPTEPVGPANSLRTESIEANVKSDSHAKDAKLISSEENSIITRKNVLATLSVAGLIGVGYYFYGASLKKSEKQATNQKS